MPRVRLFAPPWQRVSVCFVRWRHVEIQRAQQAASGVLHLMLLAPLDENQAAGVQPAAPAIDDRFAASGKHIQLLVGAPMAVVGAAFRIARREHHLGGLRSAIARDDPPAFAEAQFFLLHPAIVQRAAPEGCGPPPDKLLTDCDLL